MKIIVYSKYKIQKTIFIFLIKKILKLNTRLLPLKSVTKNINNYV